MAVEGVSSTRVTSSRYAGRPGRWVVGRADEASPWALLARAPEDAPGLQTYRGSYERRMGLVFSDVAGQPLRALGSRDRRRVRVQTYDDAAQAWGPARTVYDHGFPGCTWGERTRLPDPEPVHSLLMHCYPKRRGDGDYPARTRDYDAAPTRSRRALLSVDGARWRTIPVGARPVVPSLDRQQVAAPGRKVTTIVSPSGFARLRGRGSRAGARRCCPSGRARCCGSTPPAAPAASRPGCSAGPGPAGAPCSG